MATVHKESQVLIKKYQESKANNACMARCSDGRIVELDRLIEQAKTSHYYAILQQQLEESADRKDEDGDVTKDDTKDDVNDDAEDCGDSSLSKSDNEKSFCSSLVSLYICVQGRVCVYYLDQSEKKKSIV